MLIAVQHERGPRKPKSKDPKDTPPTSQLRIIDGGQSMVTSTTGVNELSAMLRTLTAAERLHTVAPSEEEMTQMNNSAFQEQMKATSAFSKPVSAVDPIQEIAARLLFTMIRWVKVLPPFQNLCTADQVCFAYRSVESLKVLFIYCLRIKR